MLSFCEHYAVSGSIVWRKRSSSLQCPACWTAIILSQAPTVLAGAAGALAVKMAFEKPARIQTKEGMSISKTKVHRPLAHTAEFVFLEADRVSKNDHNVN